MNKNQEFKVDWKLILFSVVISTTLTVSFSENKDIFWTVLFLLIFLSLFLISFKLKHKLLTRLISIFGLSHLILFPYLYVILLNFDSNSFDMNRAISKIEKDGAFKELNESYTPLKLKAEFNILDSVIRLIPDTLDTSIGFLIDKNVLLFDNYLVYRSSKHYKTTQPMPDVWTIVICNKKGKFLMEAGLGKYEREDKLKIQLIKEKEGIVEKIENYNSEKARYERDEIWSYSRILWYSINIFESKHISPNTRLANIIYFMHRFIVYLLLVFIGTNCYNIIAITKKD